MRYLWAVLLGLALGVVLRRARAADVAPSTPLPPAESVEAALTRQEIRALRAKLAEAKEEERRVSTPPVAPRVLTFAEELRAQVKRAGQGSYIIDQRVMDWLNEEPSRMGELLGWVKEELAAGGKAGYLEDFLNWSLSNGEPSEALIEWMWASQESEPDATKRRLTLGRLALWKSKPGPDRARVLAASLPGTSDVALREEATTALLPAGPEHKEAVLESLRALEAPERRARVLAAAWERRGGALGMSELRSLTRAEMTGAEPRWMIERAETWVPKYVSPFAPQETVALFAGTLRKADVDPFHKSISLMVIGSVASIFPGRPGRAEIEAAAAGADDERLRAFAAKVVELLDQGKTYAELRQLDPGDFGLSAPR